MPRDPVDAPGRGIAGHEARRARSDEARSQEHEGERHADVHRPTKRRSALYYPEPRAPMLVREEGPYERDEKCERDERVQHSEERLANARDDPAPVSMDSAKRGNLIGVSSVVGPESSFRVRDRLR